MNMLKEWLFRLFKANSKKNRTLSIISREPSMKKKSEFSFESLLLATQLYCFILVARRHYRRLKSNFNPLALRTNMSNRPFFEDVNNYRHANH